MSDCDAVVGAIEEAQRILSANDRADPRQTKTSCLRCFNFSYAIPPLHELSDG